ncbi:MAG: hypothetical protein Hyperionvirus6_47 [Hyperionvirus sp.]|uniref:Uncharacterized protein n=1 Tax=Hyperionvirus sp. TaxID=2487770 RepID=A0A3G5A7X6_9VIRU|nr:MAG: hypothetical protein Hyperionvirus6_47 [Hyperionvirus sp.]
MLRWGRLTRAVVRTSYPLVSAIVRRKVITIPHAAAARPFIVNRKIFFAAKESAHWSSAYDNKRYMILSGNCIGNLSDCVRSYLENGWKVIGGPRHVNGLNGTGADYFYQMIIRDPKFVGNTSS